MDAGQPSDTRIGALNELRERYLKDMNCVECRPICRLGWSRQLKQRGYKITHLVMEKRL